MEFLKILDDINANFIGGAPGSISRVNLLETCPFQWKCRYVDKVKGVEAEFSIDTKVGSFVHAVAEKHVLVGSRNNYVTDEKMFEHSWASIASDQSSKFSEEVIETARDRLYINTQNVLNRVFASIRQYSFVPKTELRISYNLAHEIRPYVNWKNALWCSIVDLCLESRSHSMAVLIDYKSHASSTHNAEMTAKEKRQINTYALFALLLLPGVNTVHQSIAYLGDEVVTPIDVAHRDNFNKLLLEFTEYLSNYREALKTTQFEPRITEYCKWCGYPHLCGVK